MKKILSLLAIAAMVCMAASCNKEKKTKHHDDGDDVEYNAPIAIDGNFADWALLGDKVTSCSSLTEEGNDLKEMKIYADEYFVYIYLKFNFAPDPAWVGDNNHVIVNTFINTDNDIDTGGYIGKWDQNIQDGEETISKPCFDIMTYDVVYDQGEWAHGTSWIGSFSWEAENNTDGWDPPCWVEQEAEDFAISNGTDKEYELALCRELNPKGKWADEFTIGVALQCGGWDITGWLPDAATGYAKPLTVRVDK